MSKRTWNRLGWIIGLLAFACSAFNSKLTAGDRIIVGSNRPKFAPNQNQKEANTGTDLLKELKHTTRATELVVPKLPPISPLSPKEQKRMQNARDEKRNWLLLDSGELQAKDDEKDAFGVRDISLDDLEKQDNSRDYTFSKTGLGQRRSFGSRAPGERANREEGSAPRSTSMETEQDAGSQSSATLNLFGSRTERQTGAHMSSELNLKNLLDTTQIGPSTKSEATLADFLKDNAPTAPSRYQLERRENFRQFLNTPAAGSFGGPSDPINARQDLTQQRLNPVLPVPAMEGFRPVGQAAGPLAMGSGLGSRSRPAGGLEIGAPRMPMPGSSLPSTMLTPNDPLRGARPTGPGNNASMFNRDVPRRGGL